MGFRKTVEIAPKFHVRSKTGKELKLQKEKVQKNMNSLPKDRAWHVR